MTDTAPPLASTGERTRRDRGMAGDSALISAASALSRITGLARIVVAASLLGATVLGDLFVAVNVLPLMLYDVLAGSAISSVLVPPLVRLLGLDRPRQSRRLAADALGLVLGVMALVAELAILGRGWLAAALTAGAEPGLADDAARIAGWLLVFIVPQLVVYGAIGVLVSIQHAHRRFLLPSAAPIVENLGLIATIVVAWARYGSGNEVDTAPFGLVVVLGVGSGLSVLAHAAIQFVGAWRAAGSVGIGADWNRPAILGLRRPVLDSFGWSATIAARHFALVVAAAFAGAGGVQAFEIATLAYFIPVALIGRPVASAALPRLAAADDRGRLAGYLSALRLTAWLAVPAGVAMVLTAPVLAAILTQGAFEAAEAGTMLIAALVGLGLGAASEALFEVARQATMAGADRRGLGRSTAVRLASAAIGIPAVVALLDGPVVLLALGAVVSAGDLAALAVLHRHLRSHPSWATARRSIPSGGGPRSAVAAFTSALDASPPTDQPLAGDSTTHALGERPPVGHQRLIGREVA